MGTFAEPNNYPQATTFAVPLFSLEPQVGEPARFGFVSPGGPVLIDTSIRTGADYGITVSVNNIPEAVGFLSSEVTVWGVPGDVRHDKARGWDCLNALRKDPSPPVPCRARVPRRRFCRCLRPASASCRTRPPASASKPHHGLLPVASPSSRANRCPRLMVATACRSAHRSASPWTVRPRAHRPV